MLEVVRRSNTSLVRRMPCGCVCLGGPQRGKGWVGGGGGSSATELGHELMARAMERMVGFCRCNFETPNHLLGVQDALWWVGWEVGVGGGGGRGT
jgi:hypothetical protein